MQQVVARKPVDLPGPTVDNAPVVVNLAFAALAATGLEWTSRSQCLVKQRRVARGPNYIDLCTCYILLFPKTLTVTIADNLLPLAITIAIH